MNRDDAQWYLEAVGAFLNDPNLDEWNGLPREYFLSRLKELFAVNSFTEAEILFNKVINGSLQVSSIPDKDALDYWKKELEKAKKEQRSITEEAKKEVAAKIALWKKSQPYLPLAEAAKQKPLSPKEKSEEAKWQEVNEELTLKIQNQLIAFDQNLAEDPELLAKLTEEIKTGVVSLALTEDETELETKLKPVVNEVLTKNGYLINAQKQEALIKNVRESAQKEVQEIRATNDSPIAREILDKYALNTEGVAFTPAYILTNPSLILAYSQKALVALPVKFLQQGAEEASPQWQKMLKEGVFVENYDLTIKNLVASGLSENHPSIIKLQRERDRLYDVQKTPEGKDKSVVGLLKTFFKPNELLGKQKGVSDTTGIALSGKTLWHGGKGWAFNVKNAFNNFGFFTKLYEKVPSFPGKSLIAPNRIFKVSLGTVAWANRRYWRGAYLGFAKTAAGKAFKTGIRKASVWLGTKLGIQAGVLAAGAATGPGILVAAVINVGIEIVGFVWNRGIKPIFQKISQWIKNPEIAFAALIGGFVVLPISTAIGAALIITRGLGLAAGIGSVLGGLATGATSLFSALISAPMSGVPVTAFLVTVLGSVGALTFFVVITTSSAFILPKGLGGGIGGPPLALVPPECQSPRHLSENVLCQLNSCGIQSVTSYNFSQVQACMGNFPNKDTILNQFQASLAVDRCSCLQCVGFVRGIMSALGKDPGGGKDAKDYLDDNVPSGYIKSMDMSSIAVGDLAVMRSGLYGHITIVVKRDGNKITVAQAWGGTGAVNMTDFNISQFDGYLRP